MLACTAMVAASSVAFLVALSVALSAIPAMASGAGASGNPHGLGRRLGEIVPRERPLPLLKPGAAPRPLPPPEERVQAMARLGAGFRASSLEPYGWRVLSDYLGFATLEGDPALLPLVQAQAASLGILEVRPSRSARRAMQAARKLSHVDEILNWGPAPNPGGVNGKGVLVGIVDYGFDTHHPAFLDSAGRTRFLAIWDPNKPTQAGAPFNHGQLRRQADLQADPAFGENKDDLHGTLVASIAAGSDRSSAYYGVAPEASLLGVNLSTPKASSNMETNIMQGIQWMFRVADSLDMPCVVNLSLGHQHLGPHDGTSLFDRFLDTVGGPGHIVVGAAGNDGALKLHADIPLDAGDTVGTWCAVPCLADVWGEAGKPFRYQILLMDSGSHDFMSQTTMLSTSTGTGRVTGDSINWTDPVSGRRIPLIVAMRPEKAAPGNSKPHVEIQVASGTKDTSLAPRGIRMGIRFLGTGRLHAWNVGADEFTTEGLPGFVAGDNGYTLSEIAGTSKGILSVGAWVTTKVIRDYMGAVHDNIMPQEVGEGALWSGRGPSVDGRAKPDISAPGGLIASALSHSVTDMPAWMLARTVTWPDPSNREGRYLAGDGTSQAAPFTAGTVALMLEVKPTLTLAEIRTLLAQTAMKDAFTGPLASPDPLWGYGKLDAAAAVRKLKAIPDPPTAGARNRKPGAGFMKLRARFAAGHLAVDGLDASVRILGSLYDWKGRRVSELERLDAEGGGGGSLRFALRTGTPGTGVYFVVLRTPDGDRRLRVFRD